MFPGLGIANAISKALAQKHDHTNRRKYIGGRPSRNKYAGWRKAMASKKPRHIHLTEFMRTWKPRYLDGVKQY